MTADASARIGEHIKTLGDWRGSLMSRLRTVIKAADPSLKEERKWGTPVFTSNGNVCALGAFKDSVKVNFFKGARVPDPKR